MACKSYIVVRFLLIITAQFCVLFSSYHVDGDVVSIGVMVEPLLGNGEMNLMVNLLDLFKSHIEPLTLSILMTWRDLGMEIVPMNTKGVGFLNASLTKTRNVSFILSVGSEIYAQWVNKTLANNQLTTVPHVAIIVQSSDFTSTTSRMCGLLQQNSSSNMISWPSPLQCGHVPILTSVLMDHRLKSSGLDHFIYPTRRGSTKSTAGEFGQTMLHKLWEENSVVATGLPCNSQSTPPVCSKAHSTHRWTVSTEPPFMDEEFDRVAMKNDSHFFWLLTTSADQQASINAWNKWIDDYQRRSTLSGRITVDGLNVAFVTNFCFSKLCILDAIERLDETTATFILKSRNVLLNRSEMWSRISTAIFIMYKAVMTAKQMVPYQNASILIPADVLTKEMKTKVNAIVSSAYISATLTNLEQGQTHSEVSAYVRVNFSSTSLEKKWTVLTPGIFLNQFTRFPDSMNVTLTALTGLSGLLSVGGRDADGNLLNVSSFFYDLIVELARRLNFKLRVRYSRDFLFGSMVNGSWNGIVKDLLENKGDFGFGSITISQARARVVDFSAPYMQVGANLLLPRPQLVSSPYRMFTPYHWIVWVLICAALFFTGCVIYLISRFSPFSAWNLGLPDAITDEVQLPENGWALLGSFLQQGQDFHPNAVSARVVMASWWIFSVLIIASYTANMTAYLSQSEVEPSISKLEDLGQQSRFQLLFIAGTNYEQLFRDSPSNSVYRRIYNATTVKTGLTNATIAREWVAKERKWAFINDNVVNDYFAVVNCSWYVTTKDVTNVASYGLMFPKNSPYLQRFNQEINSMVESGVISKMYIDFLKTRPSAECGAVNEEQHTETLNLFTVAGAFIVIGVCFVAAGVIILVEVAVARSLFN